MFRDRVDLWLAPSGPEATICKLRYLRTADLGVQRSIDVQSN